MARASARYAEETRAVVRTHGKLIVLLGRGAARARASNRVRLHGAVGGDLDQHLR